MARIQSLFMENFEDYVKELEHLTMLKSSLQKFVEVRLSDASN